MAIVLLALKGSLLISACVQKVPDSKTAATSALIRRTEAIECRVMAIISKNAKNTLNTRANTNKAAKYSASYISLCSRFNLYNFQAGLAILSRADLLTTSDQHPTVINNTKTKIGPISFAPSIPA